MVGVHQAKGITQQEVVAACHRVTLSVADAALVRSGQAPSASFNKVSVTDTTVYAADAAPHGVLNVHSGQATALLEDQAYAAQLAQALSDSHWASVHQRFPTVIMAEVKAFSIACHLCGANAESSAASASGAHYMAGIVGIQRHIHRSHSEIRRIDRQAVFDLCKPTAVNAGDVDLIKTGRAPRTMIHIVEHDRQEHAHPTEAVESEGEVDITGLSVDMSLGQQRSHLSNTPSQSTPAKRFDMISDEYPTVILGNDAWETIRCHSCGANARLRRRLMDFMKGITGLASHYRQIHLREGGWSHEDVYASCLREALDPAVAQKILNGEPNP